MAKTENGVEKTNIDEVLLNQYSKVSTTVKKIVAKESGVKATKDDDTVLMTASVEEDSKDIHVEIKRRRKSFKIIKELFKDHSKALVIGLAFWSLILLNVLTFYRFFMAINTLDVTYTDFNNYFYEILLMIGPLILWIFMTNYMIYNFRLRKVFMFRLAFFFFNFMFIRLTFILAYKMFVPLISNITPTVEMTVPKIVGFAYLVTMVPTILTTILLITIAVKGTALNKDFMDKIRDFRLFKVYDLEKFSKFEYTFKIVKNIETGKYITIPQKDRQMHLSIIGATGTAKTSSVYLPGIVNDLKVRLRNKDALKKALWHYTKKGLFRVKKPFEDIDFEPDFFEVNPDYKVSFIHRVIGRTPARMLEYLLQKYEIAGQTILAPEDSLIDDAYDLITKYGEKANRVDPKLVDGKLKEGFKGINILYISPSMPEWNVDREKVRRATLLADVMQIMFEMGGKSDPYFASVNRIASTTVALLLQLTYPDLKGRQPNLVDVRDGLNNFSVLREHYDHLFPDGAITLKNKKWLWLKDNIINYFLGPGAETFEQHARGLKVQFTSFLADDYIASLVSADEVIDFDEMLSKNQLTVANIEYPEIGPINSPALGLFFTMNMNDAVLRRPGTENTRSFHVWRIDEFPIVVTPSMEQAFTLYRKFKVSMEVALQTLDQMKKTPYLQYLAGVILNSTANQIYFGRASLTEMELVSKLSGTFEDEIDMVGTSETSIFTNNPTLSTTKRKTKTIGNNIEESDVRFKDFQEVQYSYTKRGSLMPSVHGKVEFLSRKAARGPRKIKRRNWKKLYDETSVDTIESMKEVIKKDKKPTLELSAKQIDQITETKEDIHVATYVDESREVTEQVESYVVSNEVTYEEIDFAETEVVIDKLVTKQAEPVTKEAEPVTKEIEPVTKEIDPVIEVTYNQVDEVEELDFEEPVFDDTTIKVDPYEARAAIQNQEAPVLNSNEARKQHKKQKGNEFMD
ncbi:MAG: TraM recognition domain-containing protein [Clostridiales bacterium]|nr:TraM recognition domain-containing protein [Clostridiales bacterium]